MFKIPDASHQFVFREDLFSIKSKQFNTTFHFYNKIFRHLKGHHESISIKIYMEEYMHTLTVKRPVHTALFVIEYMRFY